MEGCENVHCPLLLIDTGLMSMGPLTKNLLQKHCIVAKTKKTCTFPKIPYWKLTESSPGLMHIETACAG